MIRILDPTEETEEFIIDETVTSIEGEIKDIEAQDMRDSFYVLLTKEEWETLQARLFKLEERDAWLECLECAGVDNWQGIDYAYRMQSGEEI